MIEPRQLWCWVCPDCAHAEILRTISGTSLVLTCFECDTQSEVKMPYQDEGADL